MRSIKFSTLISLSSSADWKTRIKLMFVPVTILLFLALFTGSFLFVRSLTTQAGQAGWQIPQSGWLYVLDTRNQNGPGQILLVDPQKGAIEGFLPTGNSPQMALSPNGKRLYVVSGDAQRGVLSVVDTTSGVVLSNAPIPHRSVYIVFPSYSGLAVSPNGRWVYTVNMRTITPGVDEHTLATFDTESNSFLPQVADIPGCGVADLLPYYDQKLLVYCARTNDIRSLELTPRGGVAVESSVEAPLGANLADGGSIPERRKRVAAISLSKGNSILAIVRGDGTVFELDTSALETASSPVKPEPRLMKDDISLWVQDRSSPRSPDGSHLYLGISRVRHESMGTLIEIYNTTSWQQVGKIKTKLPFWSLAMSNDGRYLYTISPEQQAIGVIDVANNQELDTIHGIGVSPARAIVAP